MVGTVVALSLALAAPALAAPRPPAGSTAPAQVFAPNPVADLGISMPAAADRTIDTAGLYGAGATRAVQAAFAARGLA